MMIEIHDPGEGHALTSRLALQGGGLLLIHLDLQMEVVEVRDEELPPVGLQLELL